MKRKQQPRYARQQKKGSVRWSRVLLTLFFVAAAAGGVWQFLTPAASSEQVLAGDRRGLVYHEGKWLLPGEIPKKTAPQPVVDAELTAAIKAREKQAEPLTTTNATPAVDGGIQRGQVDRRAGTFKPFDGKTLQQITAEMATHKFVGKSPQVWGEHIAGVTSYLSHVWGQVNMPQSQPYDAAPKPTAKAVAGAKATVALTLDACGGRNGSAYDSELITFLRQHNIRATLFFTSSWLKQNTAVAVELSRDPLFEIGAHGTRHKPASIDGREAYGNKGTASLAELVREVEGNARDIEDVTGKRPRWFRAGTAFYDDIAVAVIRTLGFGIAGYSIAGDEGATLSAENVATRVLSAKDGDILLLHMNKPASGTREGLMQALPVLQQRGYAFVHLTGD